MGVALDANRAGQRTLVEKIWDDHVVLDMEDSWQLLYVDLHLVQEVSSPQAFDGLRAAGRTVRRPDLTLATADHAVPSGPRALVIADPESRAQVEALTNNCVEFGIEYYGLDSDRQGIVHVIAPEQGLTQPGMIIACGDSHTSTHGAFGALAFGIGTSEVEHLLATQCLTQRRPGVISIELTGTAQRGVSAKDLALNLINRIGVQAGQGHFIEYSGAAVRALSMEGRMTLCNMSIEAGARAGLVAPDQVTIDYLLQTPVVRRRLDAAAELEERCALLQPDPGARYAQHYSFDVGSWLPMVTWGTTPAMSVPLDGMVPHPETWADPVAARRSLAYMGLEPGTLVSDISVEIVFIGSCTNGRIEDLRRAATVAQGRRVAAGVRAIVVPGSVAVKQQAEAENLDDIFRTAGFEWREPGCSMCIGLNGDLVGPGQRSASTSNRNFEGRQGAGGRTHLVSPELAAAAAIRGRFVSPADL